MSLLSFEWRRARSIRTTWITSVFVVASILAFAYLSTLVPSEDGGPVDATEALTFAAQNPLALVLVSSLAAMAFGHEYRYGTIRLTLTAFPARPAVYFVKLLYTLLIPLAVVALGVVGGYGVIAAAGRGWAMDWGRLAWQVGLWAATIALLAFALTVITRNHPLGIIGPVLLSILESVLIGLLSDRFTWLPRVLPFQALSNWFGGVDVALSIGVWAAWLIALLVLGFVLLVRRDA